MNFQTETLTRYNPSAEVGPEEKAITDAWDKAIKEVQ